MLMQIVSARHPGRAREIIKELFPIYLEELSEYGQVRPHLIKWVRSADDPLLEWFNHEFIECLAFEDQGAGAGFAFVAQKPSRAVTEKADFRLTEFYIDKSMRRQGLGRRAVEALLADRPGNWELAVSVRNKTGVSFWQKVLSEASKGKLTKVRSDDQFIFEFHFSGMKCPGGSATS